MPKSYSINTKCSAIPFHFSITVIFQQVKIFLKHPIIGMLCLSGGDKNTQKPVNIGIITFDEKISEMYFVDEDLYIVIGDKLCKYDVKTRDTEELYTFPENASVESSHIKNGHIYYSARYFPASKDGDMRNIGYIFDFSINDKSVKQTPLKTDAKNTESMVFFGVGDY